ncbi:protein DETOXIFICATION 45, chloroplastic-like [Magnolia sinica]|uniref:protein DETOXIFICATION 45, chloroplastic-like n=1 Tax=Magnolia sinica TaxID=86752 RepID=UPI002658F869|nr:protein DETOXIFICATION 45, chloroplastic-like [Magnolia sinica]
MGIKALIASSFSKSDYKKVKEITYSVLKIEAFTSVFLAIILGTWYSSIAELFTKDVEVLGIVRSVFLFVSATQLINALSFVFDGLHCGVSDFSYSAFSLMVVGTMSCAFLVYAPSGFGLPGVWFGLTLFMLLRTVAGFVR